MTETSPISYMIRPQDSDIKKTKTVGTITPHLETKVMNSNEEVCQLGEEGELWVKGYSVMSGYYKNEESTQRALKDGWMKTGDIVKLDNHGYLQVTGRSKDIIIRGGENISPKEIEEFLSHMKGVENVQVIGVEDEKYGEEICALIKLKEGEKMKKEEVLEFCRDHISHYKVPKYVWFVKDLPITVTGKPQKFKMREDWKELLKTHDPKDYAIR